MSCLMSCLNQGWASAFFRRSFAFLQPRKNCAQGNARFKFAICPNCRTAPHSGSEKTAKLRTAFCGVLSKLRNCAETAPPPTKLQNHGLRPPQFRQKPRTTDCSGNYGPKTAEKLRKNCGKTALREMRGLSSQFGQTAELRLIPGA